MPQFTARTVPHCPADLAAPHGDGASCRNGPNFLLPTPPRRDRADARSSVTGRGGAGARHPDRRRRAPGWDWPATTVRSTAGRADIGLADDQSGTESPRGDASDAGPYNPASATTTSALTKIPRESKAKRRCNNPPGWRTALRSGPSSNDAATPVREITSNRSTETRLDRVGRRVTQVTVGLFAALDAQAPANERGKVIISQEIMPRKPRNRTVNTGKTRLNPYTIMNTEMWQPVTKNLTETLGHTARGTIRTDRQGRGIKTRPTADRL